MITRISQGIQKCNEIQGVPCKKVTQDWFSHKFFEHNEKYFQEIHSNRSYPCQHLNQLKITATLNHTVHGFSKFTWQNETPHDFKTKRLYGFIGFWETGCSKLEKKTRFCLLSLTAFKILIWNVVLSCFSACS